MKTEPAKQSSAGDAPAGRKHSAFASVVYAAGMVLVWLGERVLSHGTAAIAASAGGVVAVAFALGFQLVPRGRTSPEVRRAELSLAVLFGCGVAALAAYFATSDLVTVLVGRPLKRIAPGLNEALSTLWPALWVIGALPVALIELALASMRKAPAPDRGRVRSAQYAGIGSALALVFAFSFGYAGKILDWQVDLSYFRTTRAGESTRKIVRPLTKPLAIAAFFPPTNEVGAEVDRYLSTLRAESSLLTYTRHDAALEPRKAKELGATGNGVVVFSRGERREQIGLPLELERARETLRTLDREVQKRLLTVTRPPRIAYFTQGHDESRFEPAGDTDRRRPISGLKVMLEEQGFEIRNLGVTQGLGGELPTDAELVLVLGPRRPFLDGEARSLVDYVRRGGRLVVALDAEADLDHGNLTEPFGLRYKPIPLANDVAFWRVSSQLADRINVPAGTYATHPSTTAAAKLGARAPAVFLGAGVLERMGEGENVASVQMTVQSEANTWPDANRDFEPNENEVRKAYDLVAAVTVRGAAPGTTAREGRVLVVADADMFSDLALRNMGNGILAVDALRWASGDDEIAGAVDSEEDVALTHTRKRDTAWFYTTIFVAPALVIGLGVIVTRRRSRSRSRAEDEAAQDPAAHAAEESNKQRMAS